VERKDQRAKTVTACLCALNAKGRQFYAASVCLEKRTDIKNPTFCSHHSCSDLRRPTILSSCLCSASVENLEATENFISARALNLKNMMNLSHDTSLFCIYGTII
jgi:hypothetical protein